MHVPSRVIRPQQPQSQAQAQATFPVPYSTDAAKKMTAKTDGSTLEAIPQSSTQPHHDASRSAGHFCTWVTSAPLPTKHGTFEAHVFHGTKDDLALEHVAMVFGDIRGAKALPVRVHSECMTSEVFGSLKCDCKEQLETALAEIAREGRGALLYLRQEGRGIGLTNKIRAYGLQAQGHDTVDANRLLGLPDDLREYGVAADMLAHFGVESIRLLTNNPDKVKKMRALGVEVVSRQPVLIAPNPHSAGYLEAKRLRMDHELPANVEGPISSVR